MSDIIDIIKLTLKGTESLQMEVKMNILITGGTGFIGSALSRKLKNSGHNVTVTTRRQSDSKEKLTWSPPGLIPESKLSNIDAVINLAGESIASGRWTAERKKRLISSRVETTRALVESIKNSDPGPKILISASAVGFYGQHGDEEVTENTGQGTDFLAEICRAWESEALKAQESGLRVVIMRFGTVLESDGGALLKMITPFKLFLGGPLGSGRQWFPWVHRDDLTGIIKYAMDNKSMSGPFNVTSPQAVTNREFSDALGRALNRPSCLPVPGFVLKIVFGELSSILLTGQKVLPEKILNAGFKFKYPDIDGALRAIFSK